MKVFLTGATGFVGRVIAQAVLETPEMTLRVLARDIDSERTESLFDLPGAEDRLEIFEGDVLDPGSLDEALEDGEVDAVMHLVGIIAEKPMDGVTFERLHYLASKNMVEATKRAGIDRYVQMSAMGTSPEGEARYHKTKWAAEEYVRNSGLDYTILRPSIVFGDDDLFINRFASFIKLRIGTPLPGGGKTKFMPVAVEDVAEIFVQSLENDKTIGKTYEVGGPDTVTLKEIVTTIEDIIGVTSIKIPIPLQVAWAQAFLLQFAPYPFDLNPDQVTMMKTDNVGDTGPLLQDFEITLTPFREGIEAYLLDPNRGQPHPGKQVDFRADVEPDYVEEEVEEEKPKAKAKPAKAKKEEPKKAEAKKSEDKKADDKKADAGDDKKPAAKKAPAKKAPAKKKPATKSDSSSSDDKKPEDKKPAAKKPAAKPGNGDSDDAPKKTSRRRKRRGAKPKVEEKSSE